jgi:hypothetical protein
MHDESDEMAKRAGDDMALPPLDFLSSSKGVCVKATSRKEAVDRNVQLHARAEPR